jgi:MFS transporter, DHA2 family, multidrug resistance protein
VLYLLGAATFTAGSVGCAFAPNFGVLVAMRAVQGLGGSAMIVTTQTLNRALFPPTQLGRSIAVNSVFVAFGTASGPTLGGIVLAFAGWPWIFGMSIPLGLAAVAIGLRSLPHVPPHHRPIDAQSALLSAIGLAAIVYALDGMTHAQALGATLAAIAIGLAAIAIFVGRQLRIAHPLLAIELFADRVFSVAAMASAATYGAQGLTYVALPFFLQSVLGQTPLASGLLMSAWPLTALIVAARMGPASDRYSPSMLCTLGILIMGTGIGGFALLPTVPSAWAIVGCCALAGAGFAIFQTPNNRAMIASAPPDQTGRASGIMSITRYCGQTGGAALVAIIFAAAGTAAASATTIGRGSIELALVTACGLIALAAVASALRMRPAQA